MKVWNLKTKFISLFFLLIVVLSIFIYTFIEIYNRYTDYVEAVFFNYTTAQISADISESVKGYKNLMAEIVMDSVVIQLFQDIKRINTDLSFSPEDQFLSSTALIHNRLKDIFANYSRMNNYTASVALIENNNGGLILYQRLGHLSYTYSKLNSKNFAESILKYGLEDYLYDVNIMQTVTLPGSPAEVNQYIYFTYPAIEPTTKETYGVVVLEVSNKVLTDIMTTKQEDTLVDNHISPYSCITNSDGFIIFSPIVENIGKLFSEVSPQADFSLYHANIENSNLNLNLFFEQGSLQRLIYRSRGILIAFTLTTMVCFSILVIIIINRIMHNSKRIVRAINQFRKTHQMSNIEINPNDELLFTIADEFNIMSEEIEKLLRKLKNQNLHIRKVKDQQRNAEIQALQAQINPHFIYNALDHINWLAIENDQNEISLMLSELGGLLRYSISNIGSLVPLMSELEWMRKYIYIQSRRFERTISLTIKTDTQATKFPIYKMLLQPLVENSIVHGFSPHKTKNPEILLSAFVLKDGRLEINLSDNGQGMDTKTCEMVQKMCRHVNSGQRKSVGLNNVVNRLWYYYGEQAELKVASICGRGTSFRIIIPLQKSEFLSFDLREVFYQNR
jgi:two-component system sensor histidine kinase YesM